MTIKKSAQQEEPVIIDNMASFSNWRDELRKFRPGSSSRLYSFNLANLSPAENQNISNLVNSYNKECGCNSGSFFMTFILFITVTGYFITGGKFSSIGFHELGWLAGIIILAAIAGKIFGLLRARWKLIRLSNNLNEKLPGVNQEKSIITNH
jgi:hypothetical protein